MSPDHKPLAWLTNRPKTPPMSFATRVECGFLLRQLQRGEKIGMPHSRPMPSIGRHCHELRVNDEKCTWRIMYRIDSDAIVIIDVDSKKTEKTSKAKIAACIARLCDYDS